MESSGELSDSETKGDTETGIMQTLHSRRGQLKAPTELLGLIVDTDIVIKAQARSNQ